MFSVAATDYVISTKANSVKKNKNYLRKVYNKTFIAILLVL